ncbi:membrane protein insertase YidC [Rubrivirga sp. IMCC43871]|uniref:membrane protein insertase YidC n=1 Tax=Rubrivirga sp. IMCC43871 TaxID=3391575 RepID=UPI003990197B
MEPQGLDRTALIGILLMSLILGVWMIQTAPSPEQIEAQQAAADSLAAIEEVAPVEDEVAPETLEAEALVAPTDSAFARALGRPARTFVVATDRYHATFSTQGGTLVSYKLLGYDNAATGEPVELVSDSTGAIALGVLPARGEYLDTRALSFTPVVDGEVFRGDTLHVEEGEGTLRFDAPVGQGGLRFVYGFEHDSYDLDFQIATPGTDLLAQGGGYELVWDGAVPLAEADPMGEAQQGGAFMSTGGETESVKLTEAGEEDPLVRTGAVDWVAVKTKFFIAAMIPQTATDGARLTGTQVGEADEPDSGFAQDYTARLELPRLAAGETAAFTLYLGPLELRRLAEYGLYDTVDFGAWVGWMIRPIARYVVAPTFAFLSTFIPSYGLVIIVFALLIKLLLWPLTAVSYRNAAKMRELQPQLTAVKEKYGDDPQKQQEAMMGVYKTAGVNPLGGCLPMLLQYPLLIALWRFFQSTLVLRGESFLWAADLSAPDPVLPLPFTIPFVGDYLAGFTILMALSMVVSMRLSMSSSSGMAGGQQKVLMYMMPLMFFLFFNRFPSGLSLYYLAFNLFSIVQQRLVNKQVHDAHERGETPEIDKAAAALDKAAGKKPTGKRSRRPGRKGGITTQALSQNGRSNSKKKGKK